MDSQVAHMEHENWWQDQRKRDCHPPTPVCSLEGDGS
jgi:hypothetical protein